MRDLWRCESRLKAGEGINMKMARSNSGAQKRNIASISGGAEFARDWRSVVALIAIFAIALVMRLYRLEQQSIWYDELISVRCHGAEGLGAQFGLFRLANPDCTPLYLIIQYLWSIPFGLVPWNLRLLPVLINVLCVPVIYLIGRDVFGKKAGLLGALFFAVSPANIWYGQMLRFYSLMSLLVLCCVYTCLRVARSGDLKWLLLNVACSLGLLWTHPFALFFVTAEGLFLLFVVKPWRRFFFVWVPLMGLSAFSVFLWLLPTLDYVPKGEYDHYVKPPWEKVVVGFLGNDAIAVSNEFALVPPDLNVFTSETAKKILAAHPFADVPLTCAFGAAAAWGIFLLFSRQKGSGQNPNADGSSKSNEQRIGLILLLCAAFLPVLQIFLLTIFWRPCFESRYFLHSSSSLYILMAAALLRLRRPALFYPALTALLLLYAYQDLIFLPSTSRTNWRGAGGAIAARQHPNDVILVKGIVPYERDIFIANQSEHSIPVISAHTIESVCEKTDAFFRKDATGEEKGRVWAVIELTFFGAPDSLESFFKEKFMNSGVEATFDFLPGMDGILLCCFSLNGKYTPNPLRHIEVPFNVNYDYFLEGLKIGPGSVEARDRTLAALKRVIDMPLPPNHICYSLVSLLLSEQCEYDAAALCAKKALEILPSYGQAHFALGVAYAGKRDIEAARSSFHEAFSSDNVMKVLFEDLEKALYETPDEQEATRRLNRLAGGGFPYVTLLRLFKAEFPNGAASDPGMSLKDPLF
jgi:4-amino-4-deoxy-L-arabinose transferase-like glycosyltransferase